MGGFPWFFWIPVALCVGLMAALSVVLRKYYAATLQADSQEDPPKPPAGWDKLDELLSMLLTLQEHGVSHSGSVSREDFGGAVLSCACRLMNSKRGSMRLYDQDQDALRSVATFGQDPEAQRTLKPAESVAGKAFSDAAAVFESDPPAIAIPLLVKSKPIGVLTLHPSSPPALEDYNVKFLNILAGEAAVMLNNLDLLDNLQTFYLEMVQTLARAVDSKDAYTHEHSDRARQKARRLAQELKLSEPLVRYVEYAALLHDIGKIGIDEDILLKPGKLTPEEYEVMKRHPSIGHQILAPVKFLGPVAQMVLHHQEWYNGQGYPEGLKGEEIPLGARIVAVIDAWDAMTSDRPYRKALGRDIAISELRKGAGTQFDPQIVETFLRLEEKEWSQEK